jgi:hypothetical protein
LFSLRALAGFNDKTKLRNEKRIFCGSGPLKRAAPVGSIRRRVKELDVKTHRSCRNHMVWNLAVTAHAVESGSQVRRPAFRAEHPGAGSGWRIVAHVLRVAATEIGHPVVFVVLIITRDGPFNRFSV